MKMLQVTEISTNVRACETTSRTQKTHQTYIKEMNFQSDLTDNR